jgi:hypothetical protein
MKLAAVSLLMFVAQVVPVLADDVVADFVIANCAECHDEVTQEGKLNLKALKLELRDRENFSMWANVHDRVVKGEMPPATAGQSIAAAKVRFLDQLSGHLIAADRERIAADGRATRRRMNRYGQRPQLHVVAILGNAQAAP